MDLSREKPSTRIIDTRTEFGKWYQDIVSKRNPVKEEMLRTQWEKRAEWDRERERKAPKQSFPMNLMPTRATLRGEAPKEKVQQYWDRFRRDPLGVM